MNCNFKMVISIFLILLVSINVQALDNLVVNGEFDDDLTKWNVVTSPQFAINVSNEQLKMQSEGMYSWFDFNSENYNSYNLMQQNLNNEIIIEEQVINQFLTLQSNSSTINANPTFINELNWTYLESGRIGLINGYTNTSTETYNIESVDRDELSEPTYAYAQINQTVITQTSGFIDINVNYTHKFINPSDTISSGMKLLINNIEYNIYNNSTTQNKSETIQYDFENYVNSGTELVTTLSTNHTLSESNNTNIAKVTSWNNCYINLTQYETNGTYTNAVLNASQNCSWGYIKLYTNFNIASAEEQLTLYFRSGNVEIPDFTWSNWALKNNVIETIEENGIFQTVFRLIEYGNYCQYKIEWVDNVITTKPNVFYGAEILGVLAENNIGWASAIQSVVKPYTNFTTLKYDQQVIAEDILYGNITVKFGNQIINIYNITNDTNINSFSFNLSNEFNTSGVFDLNFTTNVMFATHPEITTTRSNGWASWSWFRCNPAMGGSSAT